MKIAVIFSEQSRAFRAKLSERSHSFLSKLSEQSRAFTPSFGEYYGGDSESTTALYDGAYSVTPRAETEQSLETAQKKLVDNIVVEKIPFFEVSNNSGGTTVTIA